MLFSSYPPSVLSGEAAVLPGGGGTFGRKPLGLILRAHCLLVWADFPAAGSAPIVPVALVRDTGVGLSRSGPRGSASLALERPGGRLGLVSAALASDPGHVLCCFLHR